MHATIPQSESLRKREQKVSEALRKRYDDVKEKKEQCCMPSSCWIQDITDSRVVYEHKGQLKACKYDLIENGTAKLGPEYQVEIEYKPRVKQD